jgi:hypothetical protein
MSCVVCRLPNAKEVNLVLLGAVGRRSGQLNELAAKLGVRRETLWRHRKLHLMGKLAPERKERVAKRSRLAFREKAFELSEELRRLQLLIENGAPETTTSPALKVLAMRKGLLELECRMDSGKSLEQVMRRAGRMAAADENEQDAKQIMKDYLEFCVEPAREVEGEEPHRVVEAASAEGTLSGEVAQ